MYEDYSKFIDTFGARYTGTKTLEDSIDHMINLTLSNSLNDVTTESLEVPYWIRLQESANMLEPYYKKISILGLGSSVGTPAQGIKAEAIVIRSFDELEQTENEKILGKIVVFDAPFVRYGVTVKYRIEGASKAARKGAVATLIRSISPVSLYSLHTGLQSYENNVTKIPSAAITHEDADLFRRLQNDGKKIFLELHMANAMAKKISRNTIIDLKGKDNPEKQVIVSGHIDSWDVGQGAMDDGGGMMVSWFVPVILNKMNLKPKRTIRAVLWTAEEPGYIGAEAYLKAHINESSNINFIMESDEGTFEPLGLSVAGSKDAQCIVAEILKLFTPIDKMKVSKSVGSDIALFVEKGIPGASLMNKDESYFWYHHSESDTLDVQTEKDVVACAAFWTAFSYVIADISKDIPR